MEEENKRQENIHEKGFDINSPFISQNPTDYNKIKVGLKTLEDAVLDLGALQKVDKNLYGKGAILRAIATNNIPLLRKISNYFYKSSGIYWRVCNYMAQLYRYDWYIVPEVFDEDIKEDVITKEYVRLLHYLDNSYIKKICGEIALKVIVDGCYYAYLMESDNGLILQELPATYCRSRYKVANMPAIEFNLSYFDTKFPDVAYRLKIIKMFPEEIQKAYMLYKQGKLPQDNDYPYDRAYERENYVSHSGWYLLEPGTCIKFNLYGSDAPIFASGIPAILDLDATEELGRKKMAQ